MPALVILPTYNERDNLPVVVGALALPDVRVLVVDDRSPDGTGDVADALARERPGHVEVMHRRGPRGLGRSYVDGMLRALETDARVIGQMDADLSHNPADVPRLIARTAEADLVIGSRYVPGGRVENWARRRMLLSAFANRYVRDHGFGGPRLHQRISLLASRGARAHPPARDHVERLRVPRRDGVAGGAGGMPHRGSPDHVHGTARRCLEALRRRHCRIGDRALAIEGARPPLIAL